MSGRSTGRTDSASSLDKSCEAVARYLQRVLSHATTVDDELQCAKNPSYPVNSHVVRSNCKALLSLLKPVIPLPEMTDLSALTSDGVKPITVASFFATHGRETDLLRAFRWLADLSKKLVDADSRPGNELLDAWQRATALLRKAVAETVERDLPRLAGEPVAVPDDFADVEGLPAEIAACLKSAPGGDCTADQVKAWLFTSRNCTGARLCRILKDKPARDLLTDAAAQTWRRVTDPNGKAQGFWRRLNSELMPLAKSKAKALQQKVDYAPKGVLARLFPAKHTCHDVASMLRDWTRKPLAIKADLIFPYHGAWGLLPGDKTVWRWVRLPHSGNDAVRFPSAGAAAEALPVPPIGDFVAAMVMNRLGMMVSLTSHLRGIIAEANRAQVRACAQWQHELGEELSAVRREIWDTPDAPARTGALALLQTYLALKQYQNGHEPDWSVIPWPAKPENMSLFIYDRPEDRDLFKTTQERVLYGVRDDALARTFELALADHAGEVAKIITAGLDWLASSVGKGSVTQDVQQGTSTTAPERRITAAVAAQRYHCTRGTLRRLVKNEELTDLRIRGHAKNAPLILDEAEVARRFPRRE